MRADLAAAAVNSGDSQTFVPGCFMDEDDMKGPSGSVSNETACGDLARGHDEPVLSRSEGADDGGNDVTDGPEKQRCGNLLEEATERLHQELESEQQLWE